jgi:hypothetical protein
MVDLSQPHSKSTQDYAIVARFVDPATGQLVIIAASIEENGTIAGCGVCDADAVHGSAFVERAKGLVKP